MAHLHRLVQAALFAALLFVGHGFTNAHAETIPATTVDGFKSRPRTSTQNLGPFVYNDTVAPICSMACASVGLTYTSSTCNTGGTYNCNGGPNGNGTINGQAVYTQPSPQAYATCPEGYTLDAGGTTCTGEPPQPPIDCSDSSRNLAGQEFYGGGSPPLSLCIDGCSYALSNAVGACLSGDCAYAADVGAAGGTCSEPTPGALKTPEELDPEENCLSGGQGYISTNGITSCVPPGTAGGPDVTYTDNSGGSGSPAPVTIGGDGGVDTDQDGEPDQTFEDYCEQNPFIAQCRGSFYGSCATGFICDGDAAQCAIAAEQHRRNCQLFDQETPESLLGKSLANGIDPLAAQSPINPANQQTINIAGMIQEQTHFGSAGLSDLPVSVGQFGSFTVPFSKINPYLEIMGYIVLAFAYAAAGRIVGVY